MAGLPSKFMATAPWWKLYLASTPFLTVAFAASAGRRFDGNQWLWLAAAGPVAGVVVTWVILRVRRGDKAAGRDPVAAAAAREVLESYRLPEDPAGREMARKVLPGLIRQNRMILYRGLLPILVLATVVCLVLAPVTGDPGFLVAAGICVVLTLIVVPVTSHFIRKYERMLRELDQASTVGS